MKVVVDATMLDGGPSGAATRLAALGAEHARSDRVEVVHLVRPDLDPLPGLSCMSFARTDTPWRRLRSGRRLAALLAAERADVYQAGALPLTRDVGVPQLITLHDLRFLDERTGPSRLRRLWGRHRLGPNLARASQIVAVSRSTADDIVVRLALDPARVTVVANGPTPGLQRIDDPQRLADLRRRADLNSRYVLAVGPLQKHKSLGWMLDVLAAARQLEGGADLALLLVGRADPEAALTVASRARALGLQEAVRITGVLEPEELAVALSGADALLAAGRREGFAIPVVDAQRCGVPVVAVRSGALPEVAGDGAWLVPDDDVDAAATALVDAVTPGAEVERRLLLARRSASRWSWEASARQLEELWANVALRSNS